MIQSIYFLKYALKDIGRCGFPQCQKLSEDYEKNAPDSVYNLSHIEFPDFKPNFKSLVIADGGKQNDLIKCVPINFSILIVSERLLKILLKFKLPPHKIYPVYFIHKGKKFKGYHGLHIIDQDEYLKEIDFERSKFWIAELISRKNLELLKLNSVGDLERAFEKAGKLKETSWVWAEDLAMKPEFYDKLDLFLSLQVVRPTGFFVNEKVKNEIEKNECTGVDFQCFSENKGSLIGNFGDRDLTFFPLKSQANNTKPAASAKKPTLKLKKVKLVTTANNPLPKVGQLIYLEYRYQDEKIHLGSLKFIDRIPERGKPWMNTEVAYIEKIDDKLIAFGIFGYGGMPSQYTRIASDKDILRFAKLLNDENSITEDSPDLELWLKKIEEDEILLEEEKERIRKIANSLNQKL